MVSPTPRLAGLAVTAACVAGLGMFAPVAWGFGFGEPLVSSVLGQPLRLRIPLRVDPDVELTAQCVRLTSAAGSDAIPTMTMAMARISIERRGDDRVLRIDSAYPVNEPVLRVSVEAGCAQHARREFVLLLDPPDALPQLALNVPVADAPAANAAGAPRPVAAASALAESANLPSAGASSSLAAGAEVPAAGPGTPGDPASLVLGAATIMGRVGEALSLQVPVAGPGAASLDAGCVRLAGSWSGEGPPVLSQAHLAVVRTATGTQIDLLTSNPVTVPALRVVLEAGCGTTARREYAVVLDGKSAPAGQADRADRAPGPQPDASAPATVTAMANMAPTTGTAGATDANESPKPPRKALLKPVAPEHPAAAPAQSPAAAVAAAAAAGNGAAARRAKAPAADRLILASAAETPDPAAERIAEMDKRIADLTREVALLRGEMAADRQRAVESAETPAHLGAGWVVAILALLGLGISGLINLQRKRSGMPWEKPAWEPAATEMPDAVGPMRAPVRPVPAPVPEGRSATVKDAPPQPSRPPLPPLPPLPPIPPLPRNGPLATFDELTGTTSTLTPEPGGPQTRIEVTELHADDPELGKMHTVFLESGNLDGSLLPRTDPVGVETRIPGPPPAAGRAPASAPGTPVAFSGFAPQLPISNVPPLPPPTVVAPESRHGAFTFDEGPYTQTPTILVLDLDLSTRALPPEAAEIAKFAEAAQKLKDSKNGEASVAPAAADARKAHKNGH